MKFFFVLLLLPISVFTQENYIQSLLEYRMEKNEEFGDTARSPLNDEQAMKFDSLLYFAPNPAYKVQATFVKEPGKPFDMPTSSGKLKKFRKYGTLHFIIDTVSCELPIYQNLKLLTNPLYRDYIFIPFTDLTNGKETYGGGRYIEAKIPDSTIYELDFNYSFNPYCHYTDGYNCPVPPKENFLNVRIEAGEKAYK